LRPVASHVIEAAMDIEAPEFRRIGNNTKVTREDWMRIAVATLMAQGVDAVRVMPLSEALGVSRSSFYWYFKDRDDLLDQLLIHWRETNTRAIVDRAGREAPTIIQAVLNVFECWIDEDTFNPALDAAIRSWSRNSARVRKDVDQADADRVLAIRDMYLRFSYSEDDAFIRARVLYYMQIGYYAMDLGETLDQRLSHLSAYLRSFTGVEPSTEDLRGFGPRRITASTGSWTSQSDR
jgi:AcrR family transcriptional regulator